jgi:hypothetical protein
MNSTKLFFALIFALVPISFIVYATEPRNRITTWDVLIDDGGKYNLAGGYYLNVTDDGFVSYTLRKADQTPLFSSLQSFRSTQKWFIVWSKEYELWVHSSDTGSVVWRLTETGEYEREEVTEKVCRIGPYLFRANLPTVLREQWRCGA